MTNIFREKSYIRCGGEASPRSFNKKPKQGRSEGTSYVAFKFLIIIRKQKRAAVYGCAPLVLDFKLTRRKWWPLSSRHNWTVEVPHPVHKYTKVRIPNKRYQINTVCTFLGTWSVWALRYLSFVRYRTKICGMQVKLWNQTF